jgi:CRP/FNR family transcriptional regulator
VRVARGSPGGRVLELYRVTPGELCVVSTSCLFGSVPMSAHGQTTEATDLVLLTPAGFARWATHEPFRRYVFGVFADRLADLMALAEAVAFQRLDQRLAHALLGHGAGVADHAPGAGRGAGHGARDHHPAAEAASRRPGG